MTYADIAGLTQEQAARVACGLGGGIGRLRDNCGAFSSAVMLCAALEGQMARSRSTARRRTRGCSASTGRSSPETAASAARSC